MRSCGPLPCNCMLGLHRQNLIIYSCCHTHRRRGEERSIMAYSQCALSMHVRSNIDRRTPRTPHVSSWQSTILILSIVLCLGAWPATLSLVMFVAYLKQHQWKLHCGKLWDLQKNPQGRPKTTYIKVIETQLKKKNIQTIEDGMIEARDRERWREIIQDPSCKA